MLVVCSEIAQTSQTMQGSQTHIPVASRDVYALTTIGSNKVTRHCRS